MLLCREQLYLAPKRTIARPSKTQGRATQDIQSSMHPGRANPSRRKSRAAEDMETLWTGRAQASRSSGGSPERPLVPAIPVCSAA